MIPFVALVAAPSTTLAKDAGLSWTFEGTVRKEAGRYRLEGKTLHGEIAWFVASGGRFDATALYDKDTQRTKDADAVKGFRHVRKDDVLAGMLAIRSDQNYLWNGIPVASECLYCAKGHRAWVVRLWWSGAPPLAQATGLTTASGFLKTFKVLS